MTEDLKSIKFATLMGAARDSFEPRDTDVTDCAHCSRTGLVSMVDEMKRGYVFACRCSNGDRLRRQGLASWDGERVQFSLGNRYELRFDTVSDGQNG